MRAVTTAGILTIDSPEMETVRVVSTEYNTSKLTRLAEDWIEEQDSPWFVTPGLQRPAWPHTLAGREPPRHAGADRDALYQ